jgi:hypothetical protein
MDACIQSRTKFVCDGIHRQPQNNKAFQAFQRLHYSWNGICLYYPYCFGTFVYIIFCLGLFKKLCPTFFLSRKLQKTDCTHDMWQNFMKFYFPMWERSEISSRNQISAAPTRVMKGLGQNIFSDL